MEIIRENTATDEIHYMISIIDRITLNVEKNLSTQKNPQSNNMKQVAQRATIAHLSPMCQHPLISNKPASKVIKNLNSFQIREQLFFQGLVPPMSAVWTCQKSNLL